MKVAIGLGASLGERRIQLERAVQSLAARADTSLLRVSRWYSSPPMKGGTATGWFLNGVATFETTATPHEMLARCVALEQAAGRRRARYWGDRPLDLDVLWVEGWSSDDPVLTVPHPGVGDRAFVYWPMKEVCPEALQGLEGPPPPRHGIVPVGVLARGGRPAYTALHRRPGDLA